MGTLWCLAGPLDSVLAVFDLAEHEFEGEIKEDGAKGASLFDTRFDRYCCGYFCGGMDRCGGIGIGVSDEITRASGIPRW